MYLCGRIALHGNLTQRLVTGVSHDSAFPAIHSAAMPLYFSFSCCCCFVVVVVVLLLLLLLLLCVCMGVHRVTDLEKFPVRVSRDEAPVCMGVHRVTDLEKFPVRVSRDEAPCLYECPQGNRLGKISSSSLQG